MITLLTAALLFAAPDVREGDVLFHTSKSAQSQASDHGRIMSRVALVTRATATS